MAEQQKRLNTFISAQAFKRVKLWAAEHEMTLGAAVTDLLLRGFGGAPIILEPKQEAGLSPEKKSASAAYVWPQVIYRQP
jgi:hypothetical protein